MKTLILTLSLLLVTANSYAAKKAIQCYGDSGVSAEEPFVLTIPKANEQQIHLLVEDLADDGLLNVANIIDSNPLYFLILSVDASQVVTADMTGNDAQAVNEQVALKVKSVMKKYKLKHALECNGTVTGLPRAGGMN